MGGVPVTAEDFERVGGFGIHRLRREFPKPEAVENGEGVGRGAVFPVGAIVFKETGAGVSPFRDDFREPDIVLLCECPHDFGMLGGEVFLLGGISIEIVEARGGLRRGGGGVELAVERHLPVRMCDAADVGRVVAGAVFFERGFVAGPVELPAALANGGVAMGDGGVAVALKKEGAPGQCGCGLAHEKRHDVLTIEGLGT